MWWNVWVSRALSRLRTCRPTTSAARRPTATTCRCPKATTANAADAASAWWAARWCSSRKGTNYVVSVKEWESHEVELLLDEVVCTYDFAPQQFSLF